MRKMARRVSNVFAKPYFLPLFLACLCSPALAQVQVSGGVSNFRYSVTDLNPTDGIKPVLQLGEWPGLPLANGDIYVGRDGIADFQEYRGASDNVDADSVSLAWKNIATIGASFSGRQTLSTVRGDIAMTAAIPDPGKNLLARASSNPAYVYFELGPLSSMTVELDAMVNASATKVAGVNQYGIGGASLAIIPTWNGNGFDAITDELDARAGFYYGQTYPLHVDLAETLAVSYRNESATDLIYGFISMGVGGYVQIDPVSPVPEPRTWGMLLAGLALLSMRARRWS